jgi:hypothetical protein
MRNEYMIDLLQLRERQIRHTGPRVDQKVMVEQHRGGAQITADAAAATKYSEVA